MSFAICSGDMFFMVPATCSACGNQTEYDVRAVKRIENLEEVASLRQKSSKTHCCKCHMLERGI